jgi:Bacterial transcriptional repressor
LISEYRFIYRDLTDLLSKNIQLERQIQSTLGQTTTALSHLIRGLQRHGALAMNKKYDAQVLAVNMTLVMTYWLSYDYIQSPRQALDPLYAGSALAQGAYQTLHVLSPFMQGAAAQHWLLLSEAYL